MFADRRGLVVDEGAPKVVLPPAVRNADWPQAGGNPAHLMGHLEANDHLAEAWKADIGDGGGYRKIIMAQPVVLNGMVFTMDSDAVVVGVRPGRRQAAVAGRYQAEGSSTAPMSAAAWVPTAARSMRSTACRRWSRSMSPPARRNGARISALPARSAPMIADGRVFVTTIDDRLLAFTAADGRQLWTHQAAEPVTAMLGQPAPAY